MSEVLADTFYGIALLNPADKWHLKAKGFSQTNPEISLVTTEAILIEMLNYFSGAGQKMRLVASELCAQTLTHANAVVLPQTRETFANGFDLYRARPDKSYSLTDCISMIEMRSRDIRCPHA